MLFLVGIHSLAVQCDLPKLNTFESLSLTLVTNVLVRNAFGKLLLPFTLSLINFPGCSICTFHLFPFLELSIFIYASICTKNITRVLD